MMNIMLICNSKLTKKNPFNRAFLHGRKGLCMSYKEFIENLQKEIESCIGEATILFHKVTKNNGVTKDCFLIRENDYDVSPSVYLEDYYHAFRDGATIPELAEKVQHIYQECRNNTSLDAGHFLEFDNIKNEIFCKIIGRGRNEKLLAEVPYIPYLDLAVVFYYVLENEMFGSGSILIRQEHLDFWEVTKEELWEYARENTREKQPMHVYKMSELIREMLPEGEKLDFLKEEIPMYVMTNEKRCLGACGILYDHILQEAARLLEGSFYVLPSSVHECILVPEEAAPEAAELLSMVREINLTQVPLEEVLSDQVYHYDAKMHHLTMAFPH